MRCDNLANNSPTNEGRMVNGNGNGVARSGVTIF